MRILAVHPGPAFSVADVYTGWVEALRGLGQLVAENNLGDRVTFFESARVEVEPGIFRRALPDMDAVVRMAIEGVYSDILRFRPDVLLCVSGFFLPDKLFDIARTYGVKVVMLHTESPYEDDRQTAVASHCDVNIVNDPTNLSRFPAGTLYVPHAYRPTIHHVGPAVPELKCDLSFVGTGYPSRITFLEAMALDGVDVVLAGNWKRVHERSPLRRYVGHELDQCFDNVDAADLYRSTKVGLNLYRREAERPELGSGWAMGPREVEMAACGLFFLRDPRGEGDQVLDMLPTFSCPEEASEILCRWLRNDDERQSLAAKAREAVADRTFDNHAAQLMRLLDRK